MKQILGAILILIVTSCNPTTKKEKKILEKENEPLQSELELTKKEPVENAIGYTFDNFQISESQVGIFSIGMTINEVYTLLPKEQIKKTTGRGEFAEDAFNDYEIYDSNGEKILVLTPQLNGSTSSKINRISILDNRFKTAEKIGLNSTYGDLIKHYPSNKISPDMEHIVLEVSPINAWFSIKKSELNEGWWNGNEIDLSKIPENAKFDGITIWWE